MNGAGRRYVIATWTGRTKSGRTNLVADNDLQPVMTSSPAANDSIATGIMTSSGRNNGRCT
jgi:hypothetical protein